MKCVAAFAALALASGAAAIPASNYYGTVPVAEPSFTLTAVASCNAHIDQQPVNAYRGHFYILKKPTTSCPIAGAPCPAYNVTVLSPYQDTLSLSALVPGVQQVYIDTVHGKLPGALSYNGPHSAPPSTALVKGFFVKDGALHFPFSEWVACPVQGAFIIFGNATGVALPSKFCTPIVLQTKTWTNGAGAYQYDA